MAENPLVETPVAMLTDRQLFQQIYEADSVYDARFHMLVNEAQTRVTKLHAVVEIVARRSDRLSGRDLREFLKVFRKKPYTDLQSHGLFQMIGREDT